MRLVSKRITNRNRSLLSGPGAAAPKFQGEKRGTLMKIQGVFFLADDSCQPAGNGKLSPSRSLRILTP